MIEEKLYHFTNYCISLVNYSISKSSIFLHDFIIFIEPFSWECDEINSVKMKDRKNLINEHLLRITEIASFV